MAHCSSSWCPSFTAVTGSASMAFFFRPRGGRGKVMVMLLPANGEERRARRQVQRATRARPARHTSAQRREARMTTMLGSMEIMAAGADGEDE
uniref:Uncharacterized protein n=1 Tax=Triticum urartu TaxID=4572 RepID=A0A8R7QWE5_TRIUA